MIGYTTVGTTDLARAGEFYDAVFGELGFYRLFADESSIYYGHSAQGAKFGIVEPANGEAPSTGNGVMIGVKADSKEQIAAAHAKALELGAQDEGPVGPRGDGGFFGGYLRDLDGNKLVLFIR